MALLGLPPEILKKIFDQLDPSFFKEDLSRLTVCKKWLEFALPACLKHVTLSHKALRTLAASSVAKGSSPVEGHLERGLESDLDDGLAQLAIVAQQSPRLRTLRMRASSSSLQFPLFPPGGYLSLSTMRALLSVENLSVLVPDLSGTTLNSSGLTQVDEHHICPFIGALLSTLKTLHLRLCSICPDVLKTQGPDTKLRLSTVAINLCLPPDQPRILPWKHSTPCEDLAGGLTQLRDDIQEQAEVLVTRMESPKTIRILTHPFRQLDTQSLDVLTGKTMKLEDDAAWDEDGETITETVYEDWESEADFDTPIFQTPVFQTPVFQTPDDEFDDFLFD
ncbi:uncharacterized protein FTJAE_8988 [Fusarium tjaetaba]|uniref:F-box domain-containing protein n=1 Tax=Fusarium tjaetaba TaxID=1567544 RepID=A0A8H5VMZ0_9HYPO|nr:uncharacterized protein FTJAE_8988 [Fusarium tjaetaba]KAF5628113.1 hypothetical protein FTJAE_8988 [Fusarium tjaetaba]